MSTGPTIIVRRELVDVAVRGTAHDGLAAQRSVAECLHAAVSGSLDAVFGALDVGDDHLVIERLEIDVEAGSLAELDVAIADGVRNGAEALVRRSVTDMGSAGTRPDLPIVHRTATATAVAALAEFLTTGRLPWSFVLPTGSDLDTVLRSTLGERDSGGREPSDGWGPVRVALRAERARTRVLQQFSPTSVDALIRRFDPAIAATVERVLASSSVRRQGRERPAPHGATATATVDRGERAVRAWRREVRRAGLAAAVGGARIDDEAALAASAWAAVDGDVRLAPDAVEPSRAHRVASSTADGGGTRPGPDTGGARDMIEDSSMRPPAADSTMRPPAADSTTRPPDPAPLESAVDSGDSMVVDHAGLVLLHPFLERFLDGLGLCDEVGDLTDQPRAVGLVYHLATGAREVPEYETTIAKLLCGLPLDEPVDREAAFTDDELDESEALLLAVVEHWDALRSTTPAGLRAEFLTRPGLLESDPTGDWLLRIEQRTIDVLLAQLPWGISLVRTPWMDRLLRVEWGSA